MTSEADAQDQVADGAHIVRAYLETGNYERAQGVLRGLLQKSPNNPDLLRLNAHTELMLENYDRAERSAQAVLAIEPSNEWAMRLYALALDGLGRRDEALWMGWRTVIAHPNLPIAHYFYARQLLHARNASSALTVVQEALRLNPDYVDALALRGAILKELGRVDESTESYRQALVLEPDNAAALHNLALNRLRRGKFAAALKGLLGAAGLDPTLGDLARRNIGVVLAKALSRLAILIAVLGIAIALTAAVAASGGPTGGQRVFTGLITAALLVGLRWVARVVPRPVWKSVIRTRPSIVIRLAHAVLAGLIGAWVTAFGAQAWAATAGLGLFMFSLFLVKVQL